MLAFYQMPEVQQPKNYREYEIWCFREARRLVAAAKRHEKITVSATVRMDDGDEIDLGDLDAGPREMPGGLYNTHRPHQLIHLEAMDALRLIEMLPPDDKRLVFDVIDGGDVVGYAKDNDVSLFDSMKALARCRDLMRRIAEDMADEKKFGEDAA